MKVELFPKKVDIRQKLIESKSIYMPKYCDFIELYHQTLFQIAQTTGFDLIRIKFIEFTFILHKPTANTWILDFKPNTISQT